MNVKGHMGFSLAIVFGFLSILQLKAQQYLVAGLLIVAFSMLPDIDLRLEIKHRTVTHNIFFALLAGLGLGFLFMEPIGFYTGFSVGFFSVTLHIMADLLTMMEFKPLWPFSDRSIALKIFLASDKKANNILWSIGSITFFIYILFVYTDAGTQLIRTLTIPTP